MEKNEIRMRVNGDSMDDGTLRAVCNKDEITATVWKKSYSELPINSKLFIIKTKEIQILQQITEVNALEGYFLCHSFNPNYKDKKIPFYDILTLYSAERKVLSEVRL